MVKIALPARPDTLEIDPDRTAVLLVDMQNAFASKGGTLDLAGIDVTPAARAVANARRLIDVAREAGIPVIYLTMGYPLDQSTAGGDDSPNPRKELALCLMRERPELRGTLLTFGTWDFQIVDELKPRPDEPVITKARYSGFAGTDLDSVLRARGIRYLLMAGIASNVCVESTLRDAFFHEYWPVMIEDATMPGGPPVIQQATIYNVMTFFGWVSTVDEVCEAVRAPTPTLPRNGGGRLKSAIRRRGG
jgi:ureidoacrylate peracid hydrolase